VQNFCNGEKPSDAWQISQKLEMPIRLVRQILYELAESGVVCEVKTEGEKEAAYQPGRDVEALTVKYVIDAVEQRGYSAIPVIKSDEVDKLSDCLDKFGRAVKESPANVPLKNI